MEADMIMSYESHDVTIGLGRVHGLWTELELDSDFSKKSKLDLDGHFSVQCWTWTEPNGPFWTGLGLDFFGLDLDLTKVQSESGPTEHYLCRSDRCMGFF